MRRIACVLASLAAAPLAPGAAQEVQQVTGVGRSDVLNVRRAPSAGAPLAGTLSPLASFVIVHERRGTWARISHERGASAPVRGWVAARYLEPATSGARPDDGAWACHGTEPFWSVWLEDRQVRYRTDLGTTMTPLAGLRASRNEPDTTWTFTFGRGEATTLAVMIDGVVCSDGMSEVTSRRALILTGPQGGALNGCCRRPGADERAPQPEPPEE